MIAALLLLAAVRAPAQELQAVPALTGRVIDTTGTLQPAQISAIDAKLAALESDKGSQLVVLIVPTTAPEDIAAYANRVGNAWKIGRREVGDGVILLIAKNDRRLRIEVAKTLEGAVPDIAAKHIIDEAITPQLRRGDYAAGIEAGVDQLAARIRGEALPPVAAPQRGDAQGGAGGLFGGIGLIEMAVMLFIAVPIVSAVARGVLGRKLGALATGAGMGALAFVVTASIALAVVAGLMALVYALFAGAMAGLPQTRSRGGGWGGPIILPPSGGGWSSGGGGSGGGWSSGGGGDFGGGGASGDW